MINACWIQHGGELPWAEQVATCLAEEGVHVRFVTVLAETHRQYQKDGFESNFIPEIISSNHQRFSPDELAHLDMRYGPPGMRAIADADILLSLLLGDKDEEKVQVVARAYRFWEEFIARHEIDLFIMRDIGTFATRTAYNICRVNGSPRYMVPAFGPSDEYSSLCDVDEKWCWSELKEVTSQEARPLTDEQRQLVWQMVEARTTVQPRPPTPRGIPPLRRLPGAYLRINRNEKRACREHDPIEEAAQRLNRVILNRRAWWKFVTTKLFPYDQPVEGEQYVYFPVFDEEEWMNQVSAHFLSRNMSALIEEAAFSLPYGYKLYVKEHPAVPGNVSLTRLKNMKRIPNVRVIHPLIPSQILIQNSAATVVLVGSSGWEAFLRRRPVVVMGDTWYSLSRLVFNVRDTSEMASVMWRAITEGQSIYTEREEEWLWFIHKTMETSVHGNVYSVAPPHFSKHSPENSRKLAQAIVMKFRRDLYLKEPERATRV